MLQDRVQMPKLQGLRVVRSGIHGYGVVATRSFAPGDLLCDVDGVLWNGIVEDRDDTYSLWMGNNLLLDMVDQTRFINHSCEPNAEIEADIIDGQPWARIVAIRTIAIGEEITYDYGFEADIAEPCHCGARSCRGYIVDEDELPRLRRVQLEPKAG
jgi:uncharacterized protein